MSNARKHSDFAIYRRLLLEAKPFWPNIAGLFVLSLLATPLTLLNPLPLKIIVDSVLGAHELPAWLAWIFPAGTHRTDFIVLAVVAGSLVVIALLTPCLPASADPVVWNGPMIAFTKPDLADWTLPVNQDRLTDNVWLTRRDIEPLFNIALEPYSVAGSPSDTEWAFGPTQPSNPGPISASNHANLVFESFVSSLDQSIGRTIVAYSPGVLHLISDDIYLDIFGAVLPRIPKSWALPLAIASLLLLIGAAMRARVQDVRGRDWVLALLVPPALIADYLALVGDTSDNIPGIAGVGPKTASKWLAEFGGLEGVIAHAAELKPDRFRPLVTEGAERLRRNLKLTTLNLNLPPVAAGKTAPHTQELFRLLEELEMKSSLAEARVRHGGQGELF